MSDRNEAILEAARRVFARYGVGKSTMADIAREAGVARQTLYNAYQNKEELLRASVRSQISGTEEAVTVAWRSEPTLEGKLDRYFELGPLNWFDAVQAAPDAAELVDGIHRVAGDELAQAASRWRGQFSAVLQADFALQSSDADALADFIYSSSASAKAGVESREALEQRLRLLKESVIALLNSRGS